MIALALPSCKAIQGLIHDEEVVAKVGDHKLYRSVLEDAIPDGISQADSMNFALQYIDSWAKNLVFLDIAEKELSKSEKDVSKEIEDYRTSLLKYRYEQKYINEKLDTNVSQSQIEEYYKSHKDEMKLEFPILRVRFIQVLKDSPNLNKLKEILISEPSDIQTTDSLLYTTVEKYLDYSDKWVDAVQLAHEFGTDYVTMLSSMRNSIIQIEDDQGRLNIAYVEEMKKIGESAPLEYSIQRIKDIIISSRKHQLVSTLEQDLLDEAREKEKFVIY